MTIDFSKRPEGATHAGTMPHPSQRQCWYKKMPSGGWRYSYGDGEPWVIVAGDPSCTPLIEVPVDWTGEGVPPVGTVCEHQLFRCNGWTTCTVLAYGEKKTFYRDKDGHEWSRLSSDMKFRPIRTPEQIAAEEREAKAKAMYLSIYFGESEGAWDRQPETSREKFRLAIDAGWQQVAP